MSVPSFFFLLTVCTITLCAAVGTEPVEKRSDDIRFIREQAVAGDPEAQFSLAIMLDEGYDINQDKQQAIYWLTRAAEQNLAGACLFLGIKYEHGNTVTQDSLQAVHWYTKAAVQGWPSAQYLLGMLLAERKELAEKRQALSWLSLSAEQGYPGAEEEKLKLCTLLSETEKQMQCE